MVLDRKYSIKFSYFLLISLILNILIGCTKFEDIKSYDMHYEITPIISENNELEVILKLKNPNLYKDIVEFYTGDKLIAINYCRDKKGRNIPFKNAEDVISIPTQNESYIEISYIVKVGEIGKHGYRGKVYNDLIVFDGGQALLFPVEFYMGNDIEGTIDSISFAYNVPEKWEKVIPFQKIIYPSWYQQYALYNSCFAFGNFYKKEYKKGETSFFIFVDPKSVSLADETEKGLNALYDYYSELFEYNVGDYSVVLLRKNPEDQQYIIGGAGARSVGSTFDPDNPRDWKLMSHRMFHSFFESQFESKIFFRPPQLWFYEGLATYYENCSMESLPESLKRRLALTSQESFALLFKEYIYMRIKYHPLLALAPMDEERMLQFPAKIEFLHYTQAPLVIKAIEDLSYDKIKMPNRILNYILENKSKDESLSIKNIVYNVLGSDDGEFFYNLYLTNEEILPLWYLRTDEKNEEYIINELNYLEYTIWSWLRVNYGNYPLYTLNIGTLNKLSNIKEVDNVHFAAEDVEKKVKTLSNIVYYTLKEFALRADICKVNLEEDPIVKIKKLLTKENINKWEKWLSGR